MSKDKLIEATAKAAGDWWADRLNSQFAEKKEAFSGAVAQRVSKSLREDRKSIYLECDYDPQGPLLEAVREVIDSNCRGFLFSCDGILPRKHSLSVSPGLLKPKEGYGNWTSDIAVKVA